MSKTANKKFIGFIATTAVIFLVGLVLTMTGHTAADGGLGLITFILAFMPILLVMIGMLGFDLPGMRVAPFAFILAVLLSFTYFMNSGLGFAGEASAVWAQTYSGIKSAIFIVGLIFFSFLILDMMQQSGADCIGRLGQHENHQDVQGGRAAGQSLPADSEDRKQLRVKGDHESRRHGTESYGE